MKTVSGNMKPWKLNTESAKATFYVGWSIIAVGLMLSMPVVFVELALREHSLAPLVEVGWRLLAIIIVTATATVMLRYRHPVVAEWAGTLSVFTMCFPVFGLVAGLPNIGWPKLLIIFGLIITVTSGSVLASLTALRCLRKEGRDD